MFYDCATDIDYIVRGDISKIEKEISQYKSIENKAYCTFSGNINNESEIEIVKFNGFKLTGECRLTMNGVYVDEKDTLILKDIYQYRLIVNGVQTSGNWHRSYAGQGVMDIKGNEIPFVINFGVRYSYNNLVISIKLNNKNRNFIRLIGNSPK